MNIGDHQTLHVDFTPDNANYNSASKDVLINVVGEPGKGGPKGNPPAACTINWNTPAEIVYGTALGGAQLNATGTVAGGFVYTPPAGTVLNVGNNQILHVDFTPADTAECSVASKEVPINVLPANKITPTITWFNPADIIYGTGLSGIQLNATASVAGSFVYSPAAGTLLNAGASQRLHVDFFPADTDQYNPAARDVAINVLKATPTIVWRDPAAIASGTPLTATQLNATSSVSGTFVYTPAAGAVLTAGNNQTLHAGFIPDDAANYNSVSGNVSINVVTSSPFGNLFGTVNCVGCKPNPLLGNLGATQICK
ncbi:MAG: hypothetical protein DMG13_18350 [Acidobacteria bacterium]|nr:MAG: hypothetical protein DMG13_18350 [Acidobacteriota bacterium]